MKRRDQLFWNLYPNRIFAEVKRSQLKYHFLFFWFFLLTANLKLQQHKEEKTKKGQSSFKRLRSLEAQRLTRRLRV